MDVVSEDVVELHQDVCRDIVNHEFMMLHGHDVTGYLPPLPPPDRPKTSLARAWTCDNQAMRQLAGLRRRGPRQSVLAIPSAKRPAARMDMKRPHTAVISYVRDVLNKRVENERPKTSLAMLERKPYTRKPQPEDLDKLIKPSYKWEASGGDQSQSALVAPSGNNLARKPRHAAAAKTRVKSTRTRNGSSKSRAGSCSAEKNKEMIRIMSGDWERLPPLPKTQVRIYIAGGADMEVERKRLSQVAYPQLQEYCQQIGLEFQVVDLHWGAAENQIPHNLLQVEIEKCRETSMGPYFVLLLGDKYGSASVPPSLSVEDFELLQKLAAEEQIPEDFWLDLFYTLDTNVNPPVYNLQPEVVPLDDVRRMRQIQNYLRQKSKKEDINELDSLRHLVGRLVHIALEEGAWSDDTWHKYYKSVTEQDVHLAVLKETSDVDNCMCYVRTLTDLQSNIPVAASYADMSPEGGQLHIDQRSRGHLDKMKADISEKLGGENIKHYELSVMELMLGNAVENGGFTYLENMCKDFITDMKRLIDKARESVEDYAEIKHSEIFQEVLCHASICQEKYLKCFDREEQFDSVEQFMKDPARNCHPLVIYGRPGCGKQTFLAKIARHAKSILGQSCVMVARFLGNTTASMNIYLTLVSICKQLGALYNIDPPTSKDFNNIISVTKCFQSMLENISKWHGAKKPLLIILDGVDQLEDIDRAHTMHWLPKRCPKNMHLMISLDSSSYAMIARLKKLLPFPKCSIEIPNELEKETVDKLIGATLESDHRYLSDVQKDQLQELLQSNPQPLFVEGILKQAQSWSSDTKLQVAHLHQTTADAIDALLTVIETQHGPALTYYTLCYLVASPTGLTERELQDALSCNDEVLEEVFSQYELPSENHVYLPSFLLCMILDNLRPLLVQRRFDGVNVVIWGHRYFRSICSRRYFHCDDPLSQLDSEDDMINRQCFSDLTDVFLQESGVKKHFVVPNEYRKISAANRHVKAQPLVPSNIRKLKLLPHFLYNSDIPAQVVDRYKTHCLCSFKFLNSKLQGMSLQEVWADVHRVDRNIRDYEINFIINFLEITTKALKADPNQLGPQVLGCLVQLQHLYLPLIEEKFLKEAIAYMETVSFPLIEPLVPCFPFPADPCRKQLWGFSDIVYIDPSETLAVVKNKDGCIEILDLEHWQQAYNLDVIYDKVNPNVFCSESHVLTIDNRELKVWDVETGHVVSNMDLKSEFGENIISLSHFCHNDSFEHVALLWSDEEFNQGIAIISPDNGEVLRKIQGFDVKDEFYTSSVQLVDWDLLFVNGRTETVDDKTIDTVKLNCYDVLSAGYKYQVICGQKKFHSLLLTPSKQLAVICWTDASLDVFDVPEGSLYMQLPSPHAGIVVVQSHMMEEKVAVLTNTTENVSSIQSAFWVVNIEDLEYNLMFQMDHTSQQELLQHLVFAEGHQLTVASSAETSTLSVWDIESGVCVKHLPAHTDPVDCLLTTADPYVIWTGSSEEGVIKQWNLYDILTADKLNGRTPSEVNTSVSNNTDQHEVNKRNSKSAKSVHFANSPSTEVEMDVTAADVDSLDIMDDDFLSDAKSDLTNLDTCEEKTPVQEALCDVTSFAVTQDSQWMVTGSQSSTPRVWDLRAARVHHHTVKHCKSDVGSHWVDLVCSDRYVVGLTITQTTMINYPRYYRFQVWDRKSGTPMHAENEHNVTACCITADREKVVMSCVSFYDPSGQNKGELVFQLVSIADDCMLQEVSYVTYVVPTSIHLTEDMKLAVTNNKPNANDDSSFIMVFTLEKSNENQRLIPKCYEYQQGSKYRDYRVSSNVVLRNGLSLAIGLNGDMQLWDIRTCEYEGNLYHDAGVKETQDPSLHNHNGRLISHAVMSEDGAFLVCGGQDKMATLWDLENELLLQTYSGHTEEVCRVAISWDNQLVVTASRDETLRVWHYRTGERPICWLYIHAALSDLTISRDKQTIIGRGTRRGEQRPQLMIFRLRNL